MAFKALLVCASALFVQSAFSQCAAGLAGPWGLGGPAGWNGLAGAGFAGLGLAGGYGAGCGCGGVASTGGNLPVTSSSPVTPFGVSVVSENSYAGDLAAGGNLPFLGSISVEGVLPTFGAGAISYGCGNGAVGIATEGPIATGILANEAFAPTASLAGIDGYGFGSIVGYGAGYGLGGIAAPGYGISENGCGYGAIY